MASKKYTNARKRDKNGGDNEILGLVLVIISAFILLCIVIQPIMADISRAIAHVVLGLFGMASYPIFLCTLILGVALIQDRAIAISKKYVLCIVGLAFSLLMILQLATTHAVLANPFGAYISHTYNNLTAGGVIFGTLGYGIQKVITPVISYILFSLVIVGLALLMAYPLFKGGYKKEKVVEVAPNRGFVKGVNQARTVKPVADTTLFVDTIIPSVHHASNSVGSFDSLQQKAPLNSNSKAAAAAEFEPYHKINSDNLGDHKSQAHKILFGDNHAKMQELSAPQKKETIDYQAKKTEYLASYQFPPIATAAPDIKGSQVVAEVKTDETVKKPPKKLHISDLGLAEIPMPPPKDFSDQIVGGTIVNGDDYSKKLAEEYIDKSEDKAQSEQNYFNIEAKPKINSFEIRKIDVSPAKPKTVTQTTFNTTVAPERDQTPITNGDYFAPNKTAEGVIGFNSGYAQPKPQPNTQHKVQPTGYNNYSSVQNEDRLEKLFSEENKKDDYPLPNVDVPPIISGDSFANKEETPIADIEPSVKPSAFKFDEQVVDLSEKSNFSGEDHTGYYEPTEEVMDIKMRQFKAPKQDSKLGGTILSSHNQIKIDDYVANTPVETKPKKKKNSRYNPPSLDLLLNNTSTVSEDYNETCQERAALLEETLKGLKLPATVNAITRGPAVTRYELDMPPGIPVKRIEQFSTDIEYYLAANGKIRIETPIPGKRAVGIEVPNEKIDIVGLKDIIASKEFTGSSSPVTLALGKDIAGQNIVCSLDKMPHLLIAGATGSGKSACLNSIIISILYKSSPEDVRIILIDPKHVEFTMYKGLPHLLTEEIITDAQQAINTLKWARAEMERRYLLFGKYVVRNLQEFNKSDAVKEGAETKIPYIVIIVDELAELMMSNNRKELEDKIMSMAQKARAAGIHLILATQRPSVDVITGTIKANLPSRIAFSVKSIVDSRTILDQCGAETLLGRGDMLYAPLGVDDPKRVQGAYVTNEEVAAVVGYVCENNEADFDTDVAAAISVKEDVIDTDADDEEEKEFDDIMPEVLKCVIESGSASTSMIQRRFSVGYARASRIIDQMEQHKFIGPLEGSKPRAVYISREQYKEIFGIEI